MAHEAQKQFCEQVVAKFPELFINKQSLDIGSLDINGNNRWMFTKGTCLGLDVGAGPNVDIVSKGHEYNPPNDSFDVIVSTECFEHDMYYPQTFANIIRMLKPGGIFVFTCATIGRQEHGTRRANSWAAPLLSEEWSDYYKNLTEKDVRDIMDVDVFESYEFQTNRNACDLYFWGIKKAS